MNVDKIIAYENGEMEEEEMVAFFQEMIDSGLVWQLQRDQGSLIFSLFCFRDR